MLKVLNLLYHLISKRKTVHVTNIGEKVTHPFNQAISNQTENSDSLVTKCIYPWEHHCKLCIRKLSQASLWQVRRRRSESKFGKSKIHNNELEQTFTLGLFWELALRSSVSFCSCCLFVWKYPKITLCSKAKIIPGMECGRW